MAAKQDGPSVEEAIAHEEQIAEEARKIRGDREYLNGKVLDELFPLLKRPIPPAFIASVGKVKGKPYESTGVRSVQVQIDRLNNVLGPHNWRDDATYHDDGRVCKCAVSVLGEMQETGRQILATRISYGGVDHASTRGNFYKGSYTNAAKVAIARLGPGHEIYVGVPDLDPDVSTEMANAKVDDDEQKPKKISAAEVENLRKLFKKSGKEEREWRTFLTSRKVKDVREFTADDLAAAIEFLSEGEEKPGE